MAIHRIQELLGLMQKNLECSICLELMKSPVATKCEHYFCRFCITEFLETKRSVPCPLCKQPITKRSLTEKRELSGIVDAVSNLISAFEEDSGIVYSPPKGPQSFFPCTPETINSKPENHKTKTRKNVRQTGKQSKQTLEVINAAEPSNSANSDDTFAVPSTSGRRQSRRTKNPTVSGSSGKTDTEQIIGRPRSQSRMIASTSGEQSAGLLHYLDEGSLGLEIDTPHPDTVSAQPVSGNAEQESEEMKRTVTSAHQGIEEVIYVEETDPQIVEVQGRTTNSFAKLATEVSDMNQKNLKTRSETDKENVIKTTNIQKKSQSKERKTGLAYSSQNSSDDSSISSAQFICPPRVVAKTYSRRSATRSTTEQKVQDWISALPSDEQNVGKRLTQKERERQRTENKPQEIHDVHPQEADEMQEGESNENAAGVTIVDDNQEVAPGQNDQNTTEDITIQDTIEDVTMQDTSEDVPNQIGMDAKSTIHVPEQFEEFMLTPPVRKKPIFKRKRAKDNDNSNSTGVLEEKSLLSDPYAFVVGHTPIAKSKKRGHSRSREKTRKPVIVPAFSLNADKKTVRFTDVVTTDPVHDKNPLANENEQEHKEAGPGSALSDHAQKESELLCSDTDSVIITENATNTTTGVGTRSRSKLQNEKYSKESVTTGKGKPSQGRKCRRRGNHKKDSSEDQKVQEEQTRELASWIGQAEDYELLFSTQEAQASIESRETDGRDSFNKDKEDQSVKDSDVLYTENDGIITLDEDDDSNEGFCLIGPLEAKRSSGVSGIQQNPEKFLDIVSMKEISALSENNRKVSEIPADSVHSEKKDAVSESKKDTTIASALVRSSPNSAIKSKEEFSLPSPIACPSRSKKRIAEVYPESPGSDNIVLPSPMLGGSALPKFSSPVMQRARRTRSSLQSADGVDIDNGQQKEVTNLNCKTLCSKGESMTTATFDELPSHHDKTLNQKGKSVLKETSASNAPSSSLVDKANTSEEDGEEPGNDHSFESEDKFAKGYPCRYTRQKTDSASSSPLVTTVPSTFAEDRCSGTTVISAAQLQEKQQDNAEENDSCVIQCIPNTAESPSDCSTPLLQGKNKSPKHWNLESEDTGNREELQTDVNQSRSAKSCSQANTLSGPQSPNPGAEMVQPAFEKDCDHDFEADDCSSSTEDLNITPAEHEFEEADMSLQPEEIQQKYSEGQDTQGILFHSSPQNVIDDDVGPISSPRKDISVHENVESSVVKETSSKRVTSAEESEGKKSLFEVTGNVKSTRLSRGMRKKERPVSEVLPVRKDVLSLDSAVNTVPESLPSITQVSETQEPQDTSSNTEPPPSGSRTQEEDKEKTNSENHDAEISSHPKSLFSYQLSPHPDNILAKKSQKDKYLNGSNDCLKPTVGTSVSNTSQSSSQSATPSQSILQPVGIKEMTGAPADMSAEQPMVAESATVLPNQSSQVSATDAEPDLPGSPKFYSPCKGRFESHEKQMDENDEGLGKSKVCSLQAQYESQTNQCEEDTADFQDDVDGDILELTESKENSHKQRTQQKRWKSGQRQESKDPGEDQLPENEQTKSNILVQDTQNVHKTEDQRVLLHSEQVIMDSLPECREQQLCQGENTDKQSLSAVVKSPKIFSTFNSPHISSVKESISSQTKKRTSLTFDEADGELLEAPFNKKQKLHEQDMVIELDLNHTSGSNLHSPKLLPPKSPSSLTSKVISSAPPCTTSVASESDDSDQVMIVRRTKRKCFSLDGSPLNPSTPVSSKRQRYGRRRKILLEEIDQDIARNSREGHAEGNKEEINKDDRQINLETDESDGLHAASLKSGIEGSNSERARHTDVSVSVLHTEQQTNRTENTKEVKEKADKTSCLPKTVTTVSPSFPRKKTVRGLARQKTVSPNVPERNTNKQNVPGMQNVRDTRQSEGMNRSGDLLSEASDAQDIDRHQSKKGSKDETSPVQCIERPQVPIQPCDEGEELVELNDDVQMDSERGDLSNCSTNLLAAVPASCAESKELNECAGVFDRPIIISQPVKSQTDKPIVITQSSVQGSLDATIPPPSLEDATVLPSNFDLRFDQEDEEDNDDVCIIPEKVIARRTVGVPKCKLKPDEQFARDLIKSDLKTIEGNDSFCCDLPSKKQASKESPCSKEKQECPVQRQTPPSDGSDEVVVMKKKNKCAIIESDSSSDQDSDGGSENSLQLNFTSSSALSSQSEVLTTQERSKMETELERLRREISDMETRLQGQPSTSRSNSIRDNGDLNASVHSEKKEMVSYLSLHDSSSDEMDASSVKTRRKLSGSVRKRSRSQIKRSQRRRLRISSDEEEDESTKQPRQQLMDAYICDIKDVRDNVDGGHPDDHADSQPPRHHAPVSDKNEDKANDVGSDEDSSDLFLSPLSPSPPPPMKHTLLRAESRTKPRSLDFEDASGPTESHSMTKIRQPLDFTSDRRDDAKDCPKQPDTDFTKYDDIPSSSESDSSISGSLQRIPESQFSSPSGSGTKLEVKGKRFLSQNEADLKTLKGNPPSSGVSEFVKLSGDAGSSAHGDAVPSPCEKGDDEEKENISQDHSDDTADESELPRWKRRKFGFISSGLDQEKSSLLRKLAEMNECKVFSKFNESVTHVIMKTDTGSRVCERTLKYFQGIGGQCWVLSFDWVLESMAGGKFKPEKQYEIRGDSVKGENHQGPRLSRLSTSLLLDCFAFASVGVSPDMSKKELKQLVTLTGGEVVEDPWDLASHSAQYRLVLRCVDSESQPPTPAEIELFNGQYKHFGLVTVAREWILDSICAYSLQPLEDYVCNTCKNLRLPF